MSDIPIPGVSNQFNTEKIIGDLMKLEKIPLTRLQDREATFQKQRSSWQEINRNIGTLRDDSRKLYSFNNPFDDKLASSSDDSVVTATAARTAQDGTQKITVESVAQADSFLSSSLSNDFTVPAGTYGFQVGAKELSFQWRGGSLNDFAQYLTQHTQGLVQAQVINDSSSTQVFMIRSKLTGAENRLTFTKDSVQFGVNAGLIRPTGQGARVIDLAPGAVQPWTKPLDPASYSFANGALTLGPGGELSIPVNPPAAAQQGLVLELTVTVHNLPQPPYTPSAPPPGPSLPATGSIDFQGIKIQSAPPDVQLPPWSPPPPPTKVDDLGVLFLQEGSKTVKLPDLKDAEGPQTIQIPFSSYVQNLTAIDLRNRNTYRSIDVTGIKVVNPAARGDYTPVHPTSEASDAVIDIDGVQAKRSSNTIDNLIPGVTLNLSRPSTVPVTLTIGPDQKSVKDAILTFVGQYNQLIGQLNIYTSRDPTVIDEITYLTPDQVKSAKDHLGLFQGDLTLSQLKSRLQEIMMDPYKTSAGRSLSLLAQIGISTNTATTYSGYDVSKLRGYLEVDETKLDAALKSQLPAIKQLFGNDTTGDFIVDSGVAYSVDQYLKGLNDIGGIIPLKLQDLDQSIAQTKTSISTMQDQLAQKERDLKDKYSQMQGAIDQLQANSRSIQALSGGSATQSTQGP